MESLSPIDGRYYQQTKDLREYNYTTQSTVNESNIWETKG